MKSLSLYHCEAAEYVAAGLTSSLNLRTRARRREVLPWMLDSDGEPITVKTRSGSRLNNPFDMSDWLIHILTRARD